MATPKDDAEPAEDAAQRDDDDSGIDDALADRLAEIDDRLVGSAAPGQAPVDIVDGDAVTIADHLDVILRLRAAGERSRGDAAREPAAGKEPTSGGLVIGGFRTLHEIGRGGFAVVYEAVDLSLDRRVALKVIRPETPHLPGLHRRFLDDARLAARINHPHVVTVYEVGKADGFSYIAQELCTGGSLADWLARHPGPADPRLAAEIVRSLAEATDAAHGRSVLHRDITPANVLLAADPLGAIVSEGLHHRAKLADFGLAKLFADDGGDATSRLTRADARPGTPAWMAPEQLDAEAFGPVTPATDIHALGLLLDRLLTGVTPHTGRSATEIYRAILLSEPRSPDEIVRGLPRDLVAVTLKARAKQPRHRYGSAAELAADLGRFLAGRPTHARPQTVFERLVSGGRRRVTALTLALVLPVAIVASALVVWQDGRVRRRDDEARVRANAELGRQAFDIWRLGDVKTALDRVTAPEIDGSLPARWLRARTHAEQARLLDRADPTSSFPADRADLHAIALAADGALAVGGADGTLFLFAPGANAPAFVIPAHDEINDVAFSPDGRYVATVGEDGAVRVWLADGGTKVGETGGSKGVFGIAFSPRGDTIAWGGRARTVEVQRLTPEGAPTGPIATHAPFGAWTTPDAEPPDTQALVFVDDGTIAAASGTRVVFLNTDDGRTVREIVQVDGGIGDVILSADRSRIVTIGTASIPYLWDTATGKLLRQFPRHPNWVQGCGISPDGTEIVTGCKDGVIRVFSVASGVEQARFVGHAGRTWDVTWEPSGTILSTGADGTLRRWDRHTDPDRAGFREDSLLYGPVTGVARVGSSGDWLVAAIGSPAVICRGAAGACREVAEIRFDHPIVTASSSDHRIVTVADTIEPRPEGESAELILLGDDGAGGLVPTARLPTPPATSLACVRDGVVLAGLGPVLATVDARSPKPVELADYPNAIDHIAFTGSEGGRVAIGVGPRLLVMPWRGDRPPDVGSASELVRLPEKPGNYVVEVAWSPDGSRLAYGIRDREVRVIDAGSGEPIGTPIIIGGVAMAIAWSSDGRSLVVADRDSARLCNAQVGLTIDEIRPGWPIMSIGLDDAPGRPGGVVIAGGHDTGRLLRLDLGSR